MSFFLDWARVCIDDPSMTMMGFVDWLSSKRGEGSFFFIYYLPFCFLFSAFCTHRVYFGVSFFRHSHSCERRVSGAPRHKATRRKPSAPRLTPGDTYWRRRSLGAQGARLQPGAKPQKGTLFLLPSPFSFFFFFFFYVPSSSTNPKQVVDFIKLLSTCTLGIAICLIYMYIFCSPPPFSLSLCVIFILVILVPFFFCGGKMYCEIDR